LTSPVETVMSFFQSKGWTKAQAAGITANLQKESNLRANPTGWNDGGEAYGVAQWHADRQADFQTAIGKDIRSSSLEEQLAFVDWELRNTESKAGNRLLKATTAEQAGAIVSQYYERPKEVVAERTARGASAAKLVSGESWADTAYAGTMSALGVVFPGLRAASAGLEIGGETTESAVNTVGGIFDGFAHTGVRIGVGLAGITLLVVGIAKWR
jgi:hypothetical protein